MKRVQWGRMSGKRRSSAFALFLGFLVMPSCQSKQDTEVTATNKGEPKTISPARATDVRPKGEDYQRMKDCAEQTDRIAKRSGWVEGRRTGDTTIFGWTNHYSPKYGRCYILVNHLNHPTKDLKGFPLTYDELFDAFEGRLLSTCTDAKTSEASWFCSIQDDDRLPGDCRACRQFAKDRMGN